ncbi:methylenetetrahydrofolate reductase [Geobacter argillaceus]|uniref:Methylenetetrahydrofolate reductase n=1 Tax=Geobacter argillaceus TaxID=345631 RepID=A0A562V8U4_9BACT|nr:methylenetetrahydrofolate reductase [Geobacter argillaceus]TWJ14325.1 5,10-methylenetetrahydrofolate reductase [Geobacter argillaceus]
MGNRFREKLTTGQLVVTTEVCPPKGCDCGQFLATARTLAPLVDAINVTDNQGANMRISPLAAAALLVREGIEPIYQITCRDRNRLALQSDLLGAAALGITNILALTGDHISFGDHPEGKPVFDLDSVQLLDTIARLNNGQDLSGRALDSTPAFFPGAAAAPEAEPFEPTRYKLAKKVASGAAFLQTQAIFDLSKFARFRELVQPLGVKVIAGIIVLKSAGMARYINRNIPGLTVPDELVAELEGSADQLGTGVAIATRLARGLTPLCDGIHLMAMGREDVIPQIVNDLEIN